VNMTPGACIIKLYGSVMYGVCSKLVFVQTSDNGRP
jgi:hypothetical protein